jgi:tetratricopeptide (TPR) repeat protein
MARTLLGSALVLLAGCAGPKQDAQTMFAEAVAHHQQRHFAEAAAGYRRLLRQHRDQPYWCAQALRSLANVRAAQGKLDEAVKLYRQLAEQYPQEDWEVLQAWKSAADILWEGGRREQARSFYRRIVQRFDAQNCAAVVKLVVAGAKTRLAAVSAPVSTSRGG